MVLESINYKKSVENFFHIACIVAAVSLTCWCVYIFSQDNDVCLVDFKQYNEEKEYIYPSFSLIFINPFIEEKLRQHGDGINTTTYSQFLEGKYWDERMLNISYDDVTINIADYFVGYDIMLANLTLKAYTDFEKGNNDGWKPPYVSHRHPKWKGFAVDKPYHKGQRIVRIWTIIKTSIFPSGIRPHKTNYNSSSSSFGGLEFILHYPGQIFRSWNLGIGKWAWPRRTNTSSKNYVMAFTRRNMDVLVRRNKRAKPCNEDWLNYDKSVLEKQMWLTGCRPPYYDSIDLPICSTKENMQKVSPPTPEDLNDFTPACRAISKLQFDYQDIDEDEIEVGGNSETPHFSLSITALDTTFKLIELVRAYDIQSLIGNAGGYIGIFLGYALYQMPSAIIHICECVTNKNCNKNLGRRGSDESEIEDIEDEKLFATSESNLRRQNEGSNDHIVIEMKQLKKEVQKMRNKMEGMMDNASGYQENLSIDGRTMELTTIESPRLTIDVGHI